MKANAMVINHETAMSLWGKRYGKASKVKDFAGREILKAAYNNRNSDYGWNLDHVLPQSRGGKTTESNLVCCHILTNDEKADKFPCFSANGTQFEILKVENHYEIRLKSAEQKPTANTDNEVINFYDASAGVRFFKVLKGIQNKRPFVGTVVVKLYDVRAIAILDFIRNIFSDKMISFDSDNYDEITVYVVDYNMPQKEDTADMIEKCIVLNTYLSHYFVPMDEVTSFNIFYGEHREDDRQSSLTSQNDYDFRGINSLYLNKLVVDSNDTAAEDLDGESAVGSDYMGYDVFEYNYVKTQLSKNLDRQVK